VTTVKKERGHALVNSARPPRTETEWLMLPYEYGKPQSEIMLDLVALAVDGLDERSRECIETIHFERRPYSQLAERLGCSKPHAWRLTKRAEADLREVLTNITLIQERYG